MNATRSTVSPGSTRHPPAVLKPYATCNAGAGNRLHIETPPHDRTPFQQDCDRVIHTTAFRRLMHKTQVFFSPDSDHVRTRLTHTIEVSRAARSIAVRLGLNPDLAECVALAHDLGHPPFGHAGERTLDRLMTRCGGFEHNSQAIRIVTLLSRTYPNFNGLNLCWESLEGIAKHNGPQTTRVHGCLAEYNAIQDLRLGSYPSAEAQVAALADDIAYNCHDLQDGLRTGIFTLDDIQHLPIIGPKLSDLRDELPNLDAHRMMHAIVRHLFGELMESLTTCSARTLDTLKPESVEDIRNCGHPVILFCDETLQDLDSIRNFLHERMYNSDDMANYREKIDNLLKVLFDHYMSSPRLLPVHWQVRLEGDELADHARTVADYIAGMTDNYATTTFARITGIIGSVTMATVPHREG